MAETAESAVTGPNPNPRLASGGARVPLVLLLVVLGSVAGAAIWLTLASDGSPVSRAGHLPRVSVHLAPTPVKTEAAPQAAVAEAQPAPAKPSPAERTPAESDMAGASSEPAAASKPADAVLERPNDPSDVEVASRPPEPEPAIPPPELPIGLSLPRIATGPPLSIAPDPALVQRGAQGLLPIIGADGRKPWRVYARPFDKTDKRPRIAIIVMGLGHSSEAAQSAIQGLPGPVTLAFSPYSRRLDEWIRLARTAGHEVLIHVPMEPINFPDDDPGPNTLLTSLRTSENNERLLWALGRGTGYVGVVNHEGSRFTADGRHMLPVLAALHKRGLLFVDSRTSPRSATPEIAPTIRLPWTIATYRIDPRYAREPIDARLRELEAAAKIRGRAVGVGTVSPVTFERIAAWANGVGRRGFVLAPVSAVVDEEGAQ